MYVYMRLSVSMEPLCRLVLQENKREEEEEEEKNIRKYLL
jgi:hypothetical protein